MKFMSSVLKSLTNKRSQHGFSLIEIIIVIAIIAVLIGIIVTRIAGAQDTTNAGLSGTKASDVYSKIVAYQMTHNNTPPASLSVLVDAGEKPEALQDAWGQFFCYTPPAAGTDSTPPIYIRSKGGKAVGNQNLCWKDGVRLDGTDKTADTNCAACAGGTTLPTTAN